MSGPEAKKALEAAGYVVLKRKSHEHTLRELDRARWALESEKALNASTERWAFQQCAEQRRLSDRLNAVVSAAAGLGVSIQAINEALDAA